MRRVSQPAHSPEGLRLRGHTLLCLQGFRGLGYSPTFVENLHRIHRQLQDHPETRVTLLVEPDAVCAACPHRGPEGCRLEGPESELSMATQDREVLDRLRLSPGETVTWREILARIATCIAPETLPVICGSCRWLPLGYCAEGIARLREAVQEPVRRVSPPKALVP